MPITTFVDSVGIKQIEWKGDIVKFVFEEVFESFFFLKKHQIRVIEVPIASLAKEFKQDIKKLCATDKGPCEITFLRNPKMTLLAQMDSLNDIFYSEPKAAIVVRPRVQ